MTFLHSHIVSLCQAVKQRLRQWTRPDNHTLILNTAVDLTRSKPELVLENALLRQRLIKNTLSSSDEPSVPSIESNVGDGPMQPRQPDLGLRLPANLRHLLPHGIRLRHHRAGIAAHRPFRRDDESHRPVDGPATARGDAFWRRTAFPDPRQRQQVWPVVGICRLRYRGAEDTLPRTQGEPGLASHAA